MQIHTGDSAAFLVPERNLGTDELMAVAGGARQGLDGSRTSDQSLSYVYGHSAYAAAWLSGYADIFGLNL